MSVYAGIDVHRKRSRVAVVNPALPFGPPGDRPGTMYHACEAPACRPYHP